MAPGRRVAGIDSSTQSTKVVVVDSETGDVVAAGSAPHPPGTEVEPRVWLTALEKAGRPLLDGAEAVGVAAQQHGMVVLDEGGDVLRPSLLWNDLRSASQSDDLVSELGGPQRCAELTGSVFNASFTVTKLRWLADAEPSVASRVAMVALPHDWLTAKLIGAPVVGMTTDAGDASGTGYFDTVSRTWRPELVRLALGHDVGLPRIAEPAEIVGQSSSGAAVSAGTGDNMAAALGLGVEHGDVVVSVGTSGTAFTISRSASADAGGLVAGFCDATGDYLPLVCTINASRILDTAARLLGVKHGELDALALSAPAGANGVVLLPYFDGERTPKRPGATGTFTGITSATEPVDIARAAVEALLCSLADAADALQMSPQRIILIGGGSRSAALQQLAPAYFGAEVVVPEPGEYVALGAARQAAWALSGSPEPPRWRPPAAHHIAVDDGEVAVAAEIRQRYTTLRDRTASWS